MSTFTPFDGGDSARNGELQLTVPLAGVGRPSPTRLMVASVNDTTPPTDPTTTAAPPQQSAPPASPPSVSPPVESRPPDKDPLRASRTSGAWLGLIGTIVLIILLVVFVVQNTETTSITFLGWAGNAPLAVALLVAAAVGMAIAALVGSLRIIQLRRRVRQEKKRRR